MRDETAKDNGQTAAGISHDLIRNDELSLSSTRNLKFSLCISLKKQYFTTNQLLIPSVQKPNYRNDLKVRTYCENLQRFRVKVSQQQKNSDQEPLIT